MHISRHGEKVLRSRKKAGFLYPVLFYPEWERWWSHWVQLDRWKRERMNGNSANSNPEKIERFIIGEF